MIVGKKRPHKNEAPATPQTALPLVRQQLEECEAGIAEAQQAQASATERRVEVRRLKVAGLPSQKVELSREDVNISQEMGRLQMKLTRLNKTKATLTEQLAQLEQSIASDQARAEAEAFRQACASYQDPITAVIDAASQYRRALLAANFNVYSLDGSGVVARLLVVDPYDQPAAWQADDLKDLEECRAAYVQRKVKEAAHEDTGAACLSVASV